MGQIGPDRRLGTELLVSLAGPQCWAGAVLPAGSQCLWWRSQTVGSRALALPTPRPGSISSSTKAQRARDTLRLNPLPGSSELTRQYTAASSAGPSPASASAALEPSLCVPCGVGSCTRASASVPSRPSDAHACSLTSDAGRDTPGSGPGAATPDLYNNSCYCRT